METRKIVVIGSGPGGSGIAALLAHDGDAVTLLEKNAFVGGKCSAVEQDGYIVDTGVHMFGQGPGGPFGRIAAALGEELHWCRREPMFDLHLARKGVMHFAHSLGDPITVRSLLMANLRGWIRLELPGALRKTFKNHSRREIFDLIRRLADPYTPYLSEYEDVSVRDFFSSITNSEDALKLVVAQTMLTMVLPWERASLADFFYIQFGTLRSRGFGYPAGGSGEIPKTFLRGFQRWGGELRTSVEVKRIEVEKGRVKGVTTAAGEFIPADIVVSNAGVHRTIVLAGARNFPGEYVSWASGLKMSVAFIATKYLLGRKITGLRAPCMFHVPDKNPYEMFDYLETGDVPEDLYLFITAPSLSDPFLAPLGRDLLIVGVPAPCEVSKSSQCEALLDRAERIVETRLFPELKGAVVKKQRTHTRQTSKLTGRETGECIGLAQEVGQTGTKKPQPQTPIRGLYLVGSDAGGKGIGSECAADSALYLYNILKRDSRN